MQFLEPLTFSTTQVLDHLQQASDTAFDALHFGVIAFNAACEVKRYNYFESQAAGLSPHRVLDLPLFTVVAPCMNNFLVAQRYADAVEQATPLDVTIPYVLTLRMKPVKVDLRMLASPALPLRYLLVRRD